MTPGMAVDMHAHYYGGLIELLRHRTERPTVTHDATGAPVLNAMTASTIMSPGYTELSARLAYMDRAGIGTQMITFPGALGLDVLPIADGLPIVRTFNDHLADVCRSSNGRFVGLAGLPLADISLAVAEMHRIRRELRLLGAILPGNYFLTARDVEKLRPVFAAADEDGALLMVHPGLMPGEPAPSPYEDATILRASALNLQASLSHMAVTIATTGLPADYPNVTFQVVNLGGTLPFILERIDAIASSRSLPARLTVEGLRCMVYDSASLGPRALELAVSVLGADRIMMGTDYPIFAPDDARSAVATSRLSPDEKAAVVSGTAAALIARYAS